ncbi:hypothetical protein BKA61DRAFT_583885 [Leptodontidium sp. MPI-SDFR-AT-0119]|nr:hypothetical protein BKA61DRAFT_583885 [Leptodontidium sp. MPI-SDFR-AT-0119]
MSNLPPPPPPKSTLDLSIPSNNVSISVQEALVVDSPLRNALLHALRDVEGGDNRDDGQDSVPECTKKDDICHYVLLDSDQQMSHNREIVTFDLTHLGSNQNRIILSHLRFQIHLDMSAKILERGFEVVGTNEIDLLSEWQSCLDLKIQLGKVTELKLGSLLTDDRTVWIQHRHPSRHSSAYQEPQIKRSTVNLVFKKGCGSNTIHKDY